MLFQNILILDFLCELVSDFSIYSIQIRKYHQLLLNRTNFLWHCMPLRNLNISNYMLMVMHVL
jgi:hypothetical protein